jgi:hypothetical protein
LRNASGRGGLCNRAEGVKDNAILPDYFDGIQTGVA